MKVLNKDELKTAEELLVKHLPRCLQVYGFLFAGNRNKPNRMEVIVDSWPDFKVILCQPDPKREGDLEYPKIVAFYCSDEQILRKMLTEVATIDWSSYFRVEGFEIVHAPMLKEVSSGQGVNSRRFNSEHAMYLLDISHLPVSAVDRELESQISSLDLSHSDLVNKTWAFGGNEQSCNLIKRLISSFPSCCITDVRGQPVSWVLVYDFCAMGVLYTLPEHRRKGYAKVLVSTMAKRLHAEGYPVYCYIGRENAASYNLFKSLGFTDDPSVSVGLFEFNL